MSRLKTGLYTFLVSVSTGASSYSQEAAPTCSARSREAWIQELSEWSAQIQTQQGAQQVRTQLEKCRGRIEQSGLSECFQRLEGRLSHDRSRPGHRGGYEVSDARYNQEILARENILGTKLISLPTLFKNGLPNNWQEVVRTLGGTFVEFRSWSVKNPPTSSRERILIHLPGQYSDQWIQVTVPEGRPLDLSRQSLINVIGIEKSDPPGKPLPANCQAPCNPPRYSFAEYRFTGPDNIAGRPQLKRQNDYACYSCHQSGMRQIVPLPGSVPDHQMTSLQTINTSLAQMQNQSPNFYRANLERLGPHARGTSCTECHGRNAYMDTMGPLNPSTAQDQVEHKMLVEFSMPPGLSGDPKFKVFFDARALTQELSPQQRIGLTELLGRNTIGHNRSLLDYLKSIGRLSPQRHIEAIQSLNDLEIHQTPAFNAVSTELSDSDGRRLKQWLTEGTKCQCETPTSGLANPTR